MSTLLALHLPLEQAKDVVKLLLKLGATSAQTDMNHITMLHYIVAQDNIDILEVLVANDRPMALSVLNKVGFASTHDDSIGYPISSAIPLGNEDMVRRLLELGAKPTLDFDDWIIRYSAKNEWAKHQTPEENHGWYRTFVVQPIIAAANKEMAQTIEDLLADGADPAALDMGAYIALNNPSGAFNQTAESLLDIVQNKMQALRVSLSCLR